MAMSGGKIDSSEKVLGKKLQKARQFAGLTQQELCAKANLSYSTLAKIERGAIRAPSIFTIESIADVLKLSLDELIGRKTPNSISYRKNKNGVEFIYFDLNGCLVRFAERAFSLIAKDYATSTDIIESVLWRYNDDVNKNILSLDDFNRILASTLGIDKINWADYYLKAVEPVTSLINLMEWAAENYHIGLMTNSMPGIVNGMFQKGLLPKLNYDVIIDSSVIGHVKPETEAYRIATENSKMSPEKILLIDDTKANLIAAEKYNWKTMWFDYARPEESTEDIRNNIEPIV